MFGVKSTNQPIKGEFAEQFCENLLNAQKQEKKEEDQMSYTIVCD